MSDLSASLLPRRVLVFGARGYVGTYLVPRLLKEDGIMVRASARSLAPLEARNWPGVELVQADALVPESLPAAMECVDTAYYLVHSVGAGKGFSKLDRHAAENFARAAEAAGVRCIVYLGGLFPENEGRISKPAAPPVARARNKRRGNLGFMFVVNAAQMV